MIILIQIYFIISKGEYFYTFIDHLWVVVVLFCFWTFYIPHPFFFILIHLQWLLPFVVYITAILTILLLDFQVCLGIFCLAEFVNFYSVKYNYLFTFMVVSLHLCLERSDTMKIKLLYNLITYLFTFKSYKHLDLFWCMVEAEFLFSPGDSWSQPYPILCPWI